MRDQKIITYSQEKIKVQSAYSAGPDFVSSLLKKRQCFLKMSEAISIPKVQLAIHLFSDASSNH